jgi:hypothetical protein
VDPITGECSCPVGSAIIEKNSAGQYLPIKQCIQCPDGTYPGPSGPVFQCRGCPEGKIYDTNLVPWKCNCNLTSYVVAGDDCVPIAGSQIITTNYPVNLAKSLQFTNEETIDKNIDGITSIASSDTFDHFYLISGYQCLKGLNAQSCQVLANLCVMQMYDLNNPVCKLYKYINDLSPAVPNSE